MPCPSWDYTKHPDRVSHIAKVQKELIDAIRGGKDQLPNCRDTRTVHRRLFRALTPAGHPYYAGEFRGSKAHPCLTNATTTVAGFSGAPPKIVGIEMTAHGVKLQQALLKLDAAIAPPGKPPMARDQQIIEAVGIATWAFARLQVIHPYWDGNGHVGRYLVMAILGRYGLWVDTGWVIDTRSPQIDALIAQYRAGNTTALEQFVLARAVDPTAQPPQP